MMNTRWNGVRIVGLLLLNACASSLPGPALSKHPRSNYEEVPYPPPAALAETVPPQPKDVEVVWIDGEWSFRGRSYVWKRGGWVRSTAGLRYAKPHTVYEGDGRILRAPGSWFTPSNRPVEAPPTIVPARAPRNEITPESHSPQT